MTLRPLVVFALAFIGGILAAAFVPWLIWLGVAALAGMCVALLTTRRAVWLPYAFTTAIVLVGSLDYTLHTGMAANDVARLAPAVVTLTGVVDSDVELLQSEPDSEPVAVRFTLRATQIEEAFAPVATNHRVVAGSVAVRLIVNHPLQDTSVSQNIPRYGDRLVVRGRLELPSGPRNPGGFDYKTYLAHNGIHATLSALRPDDWHIVAAAEQRHNPFLKLAFALRQGILRSNRVAFSPEHAAVLNGILLGDRANLPAALREDFERTGTTHILATAGLHVGLVMALLLGMWRCLRLSRRAALLTTLLCLALYIPMTGERVAMTRATLMAAVYLGGILLEREPYLPNTLSLAALILLVNNPQSLFDAGFQLSFGIVITVAWLAPLLERLRRAVPDEAPSAGRLKVIRKFLQDIFLIALAAQIGALPLTAYYFHTIPIVGILANVLIVPVVLPIIGLGFCAVLLRTAAPLLIRPLDKVLDYLLAYISHTTHLCSAPKWAVLSTGEVSPIWVVAAYGMLWGGAWYLARRWNTDREPGAE